MNHRLEAMFAYQKALRTGATPEAAWTAAFGAETHAQLAAEVHRYLDGGQYALLIYRLPAPNLPAPVERRLTDADAHATRALLYLTGSGTRAVSPELAIKTDDPQLAAQREVAEARRAQPAHLMADAIAHFMLKTPVDLAQATLACKASPDDWLAWLLLSEALEQSPDRGARQQALKRAADLAGDDLSVELHAERDEN
jgi:hypothetical protein